MGLVIEVEVGVEVGVELFGCDGKGWGEVDWIVFYCIGNTNMRIWSGS